MARPVEPNPTISTAPLPALAPPPGPENLLPGDAQRVVFEDAHLSGLVEQFNFKCVDELAKLKGGAFTATRPDGTVVLAFGSYQKDRITACVLGWLHSKSQKYEVAVEAGSTRFFGPADVYMPFRLRWGDGYFTLAADREYPPATAAQVTTWQTMRNNKFALWTREPFIKTVFGDDGELVLIAKQWEMPREWVRTISGSLAITFGSEARAKDVAARAKAGTLAAFTDPKQLAAIQALAARVDGATIVIALKDVEFELAILLSQLGLR